VCAIVKSTYLPALKSVDFTCRLFLCWLVAEKRAYISLGDTTTFLIWNATETNVIIIAACIPTLGKIGPKATTFFRSYFTGSRFSSKKYASSGSGEGNSAKKLGYMRHRNGKEDQSLELPIMTNGLVPSGTGSTNFLISTDPQGMSIAHSQIDIKDIRQTVEVEVGHTDKKHGRKEV
jgi:hypothetical protein